MRAYKLTAPRDMGKVGKGFEFIVNSSTFPNPNSKDIEEALKRMGYTDKQTLSYSSSGNWKVEKLG